MKILLEMIMMLLSGIAFMYYGLITFDTHGMVFMGFATAFLMYHIERELKQ